MKAARYFEHPVLGPRLVACVDAIPQQAGSNIVAILGETDALKFKSCLTLFTAVAPGASCFEKALDVFGLTPSGVALGPHHGIVHHPAN